MRYLSTIIFLAIVALIVFGAIQFKDSPFYQTYRTKAENFIQYIKRWGQVKKHNIKMTYDVPSPKEEWMDNEQEVASDRKPPMSLLVTKTKLENFFPDQFVKKLDQSDWDYIFNLIYEPIYDQQGDFKVKRYLTQSEIERELIHSYEFPFSYFQKQHWDHFWNVVLKK
ncbi:MAG: hypothetical protein R6U54_05385 [Candidatus Omnitrophota bacterium]